MVALTIIDNVEVEFATQRAFACRGGEGQSERDTNEAVLCLLGPLVLLFLLIVAGLTVEVEAALDAVDGNRRYLYAGTRLDGKHEVTPREVAVSLVELYVGVVLGGIGLHELHVIIGGLVVEVATLGGDAEETLNLDVE